MGSPKLGSIHGHFIWFSRLVVSSVLFFYIKRSKAGNCVQSQLTNLSRIKELRTDSPWKRQILKARPVSHLSPSSWVLRCVFLGGMFLLVFGSGQSDVRSGTLMPTCYVVNANIFYTLIHSNTAHAQSVDYLRVRRSTFCRMQYCSIGSPEFMFTCLSDEEQGERLYSQATRQTTIWYKQC